MSAAASTPRELIASLEHGDPRVFLFEPNGPSAKPNSVIIHCHTMQTGEEEIVAEVVRASMLKRLTAHPNEVSGRSIGLRKRVKGERHGTAEASA